MSRNVQPAQRLRVFLCHSSSDKPAVRKLYRQLHEDGFQPWLDEEDLLAGQRWQSAIKKAVRGSDVVIVCLSSGAVTKAGFLQKEIKFVLDVADEQPEDTIFVIPLKLEECEIPTRLEEWHWINFFDARGHEKLLKALRHRAGELKRFVETGAGQPPPAVPKEQEATTGSADLGPIEFELTLGTARQGERLLDDEDILGLETLFGRARKILDGDAAEGAQSKKPESKPDAAGGNKDAAPQVSPLGSARRHGALDMDFPVEVAEEEKRYHNKARRFARLLVSEIKLYNEQKVREGRDNSDLYERLRENIDLSRQMYDKHIRPEVASRYDYFHHELVDTLAEGDLTKLGKSYPRLKPKLLVADASPNIRKLAELTFEAEGMHVESVANGDAAAAALEKCRFDVVLADVAMPGLSGYELCRRVKNDSRFKDTRVLLLVGFFDRLNAEEALGAGADGVLTKPFESIRALVKVVRAAIEGRPFDSGIKG